MTELRKHREAVGEPATDGAVDESAARFAVAGIVEPDTGPAPLGGPGVQRHCLGALHVRIEAAEPEQAGALSRSRTGTNREPARRLALADVDEGWRVNGILGSGHGSIPRTRCCV